MGRQRRDKDGLTPNERLFTELVCRGMQPAAAYRQAGYGSRGCEKDVASNALKKLAEPAIVRHRAEWLRQARISDIDTPGQAVAATLQAINEAEADRNWTAIAALQRLRYQHNGIAEKTTVTVEHVMPDGELLRRIAASDPGKMALLESLLRPATFAEPEVLELAAEPVDEAK